MELISPTCKVVRSPVVLLKEETDLVLVVHPLVLESVVTKEKDRSLPVLWLPEVSPCNLLVNVFPQWCHWPCYNAASPSLKLTGWWHHILGHP